MIDPKALRAQIQQVLTPLGLYSTDAEELLMATCANESDLGSFRTQIHGPARGIFQDEGEDFTDLFANYLSYHPMLYSSVVSLFANQPPQVDELINNDAAAIAICRVHYLRAPGAIPAANDLDGIWNYYKKYYNSAAGAAAEETFKLKYAKYVQQTP
jgi:hypothetical protein